MNYPNFYQKRTVDEQASRLPSQYREHYISTQLDKIWLFDGLNEFEVHGFFEYSFMEEKSYTEQPTRSIDGKIENIDDYETFLTPRLIIKYNLMGIEDYRKLMKTINSTNGIIVRCYDIVEDKIVKHEMYFAPPSMPTIYQRYLTALGVQEFSIELIGTNTASTMTFDVSSTTYECKKGMTWVEFSNSEDNDYGFYCSGNRVYKGSNTILLDGVPVSPNDYICALSSDIVGGKIYEERIY